MPDISPARLVASNKNKKPAGEQGSSSPAGGGRVRLQFAQKRREACGNPGQRAHPPGRGLAAGETGRPEQASDQARSGQAGRSAPFGRGSGTGP